MNVDRAVIRHARQSDAEGIARVHIASADDSLAPLAREWPASNLDRRTEQWAKSLQAADRLDMVATVANQVVGFLKWTRSSGPEASRRKL
jgi:L-amino acid N-acyltransferase YncA